MSGKPEQKYKFNGERFKYFLKTRKLTIQGLAELPDFDYSVQSVYKAVEDGYMTLGMVVALASVLEFTSIHSFLREINSSY